MLNDKILHTNSKTFETGDYNKNLPQSSDHQCDQCDLFESHSACQTFILHISINTP